MYIPRPQRRDGRGGSHYDPVDFSKPVGERDLKKRFDETAMIRSFTTKRAAQNLLTSWLKGKFAGDMEGEVWHIHGSSREHMREQMEIVEITIVLPT